VRGNVDVHQIDARFTRTIFEPSIKVNRTLYDLLLLKLMTGSIESWGHAIICAMQPTPLRGPQASLANKSKEKEIPRAALIS
jgi:hypothetical protein